MYSHRLRPLLPPHVRVQCECEAVLLDDDEGQRCMHDRGCSPAVVLLLVPICTGYWFALCKRHQHDGPCGTFPALSRVRGSEDPVFFAAVCDWTCMKKTARRIRYCGGVNSVGTESNDIPQQQPRRQDTTRGMQQAGRQGNAN